MAKAPPPRRNVWANPEANPTGSVTFPANPLSPANPPVAPSGLPSLPPPETPSSFLPGAPTQPIQPSASPLASAGEAVNTAGVPMPNFPPAPTGGQLSTGSTGSPSAPVAGMMMDFLRPPKKRNRTRGWEKRQAARLVKYRGVPKELSQRVKAVAKSINVSADDVARAFLEYGLATYRSGQLRLEPYAHTRTRMTLHPDTDDRGRNQRQSVDQRWKEQVAYRRFPADLREAIASTAQSLNLPNGEVVTEFLKCGLSAYRSGQLPLVPVKAGQQDV